MSVERAPDRGIRCPLVRNNSASKHPRPQSGCRRTDLGHQAVRSAGQISYTQEIHRRREDPQTNGKLERYHLTIKLDVNQIPYDVPGNLEVAITEFVNYYNNRRYHKALRNVTPSDVLDGRREQILEKRKDVQAHTFQRRRLCNQYLRELAQSAPNFHKHCVPMLLNAYIKLTPRTGTFDRTSRLAVRFI